MADIKPEGVAEKYTAFIEKMAGPEVEAHAKAMKERSDKGDITGAAGEYLGRSTTSNRRA